MRHATPAVSARARCAPHLCAMAPRGHRRLPVLFSRFIPSVCAGRRLSHEGRPGRMVLDDWDGRLSKLRRTRVMLGTLGRLPLGCDQGNRSGRRDAARRYQAGRKVGAMRWDLGLQGLGLLIAMSLGFGIIAQLVVGKATTRWLWLIAAAGYFVGGLFTSEVWFGWATQE